MAFFACHDGAAPSAILLTAQFIFDWLPVAEVAALSSVNRQLRKKCRSMPSGFWKEKLRSEKRFVQLHWAENRAKNKQVFDWYLLKSRTCKTFHAFFIWNGISDYLAISGNRLQYHWSKCNAPQLLFESTRNLVALDVCGGTVVTLQDNGDIVSLTVYSDIVIAHYVSHPLECVFVDVAVDENIWLGLLSDGRVCVGRDREKHRYIAPYPGTCFSVIAAGMHQNIAMLNTGAVFVWGHCTDRQCMEKLKNKTDSNWCCGYLQYMCNVPLPAPGTKYIKFSVGLRHTLGLCSDGTVLAWGDNRHKQCLLPASVWLKKACDIQAISNDSLVVFEDGSVMQWGAKSEK